MHTERRLKTRVFEQATGLVSVANAVNPEPLLAEVIGPLNTTQILQANRNALVGELHVYTHDSPCPTLSSDNNMFSCVRYYKSLAADFPNIDIHIYCHNVNIAPRYLVNNTSKTVKLTNSVVALLQTSNAKRRLRSQYQQTWCRLEKSS